MTRLPWRPAWHACLGRRSSNRNNAIVAMSKPVRLAVVGAGLIGKRHVQFIKSAPEAELVAIVDPSSEAKLV
jgi:predicted homoserine dehydrogenase-like protein